MRCVVPDYDAVYKNLQSVSNKNVLRRKQPEDARSKTSDGKKVLNCNKTADVE